MLKASKWAQPHQTGGSGEMGYTTADVQQSWNAV